MESLYRRLKTQVVAPVHRIKPYKNISPKLIVLFCAVALAGCQELPQGQPAQVGDITIVISNIITLLAPFALIAFFAMLIWGGFQLIISGGDPKAAAGARNTFTFAILGIILVVVVWLLLLLIENITGVEVTNVAIPGL